MIRRLILHGALIAVVMLTGSRVDAVEPAPPGIRHIDVAVGSAAFRVEAIERPGVRSMDVPDRVALLSPSIPVPFESADPFLAISAVWTAESGISPSLRGSVDGTTWSAWEPMGIDADSSIGFESVAGLMLLPKETRAVQFRLELPPESTATLGGFRAVFISPGSSTRPVEPPARHPAPMEVEKPPVVSRVGWGCPDGESSPGWTPKYTTVTHLIVHHTVNSNSSPDWAAVVRAIFALHTYTNGWGDIGYNYLVDPNGVIYEGRAGGDNVIGAHFTCANSNTMGVALLGTFTSVLPANAAWDSVAELLAWKANQRGIDPYGSTYHSSTQLMLPNVAGHRDGNATTSPSACPKGTECPGNALYAMLGALREDVATLIPPPAPSIAVAAPDGGEAWPVGVTHTITWLAENLDPSGEIRIFLSRDGGATLDDEPLAVVGPGTTSFAWTPTVEDLTTSAKFFIACVVDGSEVVSDWSDGSFMIIDRRRTFRRP